MSGRPPDAALAQQAQAVLQFWFEELTPDRHWAKDAALDGEITRRFAAVHDAVLLDDAAGWRQSVDSLLAAVIVLDQFSRNMFRNRPEAFAADPLALELALSAIAAGHHRELPALRRGFLYMPLMHAEHRGVQRFSLLRFGEPGLERQTGFARDHAAVIERFGRFPTRNAILGRPSTAEELDYLSSADVGW